jgi:hypothetical protein
MDHSLALEVLFRGQANIPGYLPLFKSLGLAIKRALS